MSCQNRQLSLVLLVVALVVVFASVLALPLAGAPGVPAVQAQRSVAPGGPWPTVADRWLPDDDPADPRLPDDIAAEYPSDVAAIPTEFDGPMTNQQLEAADRHVDRIQRLLEDAAVVRVTWDAGEANYTAVEGLITVPLAETGDVSGVLAWFGRGCDGDEVEQDPDGGVALVGHGACSYSEKILNAQTEGAIAVIEVYGSDAIRPMGGDPTGIRVPGVMISSSDGTVIRDLLIGGTSVDVTLSQAPLPEDPYSAIDRCITHTMQTMGVPGASLAIAENGKLSYVKAYGVKHAEQGGQIDAETMFRVASISKMMTAAAVLQQVDAGTVELDAPATRYIPDLALPFPWRADDILVRHLLMHSAGLADDYTFGEPYTPEALGDWVAQLAGWTVYAPPGSFYNYSNPTFNLAGLVAERASGMAFHRYVKENVWATAGMTLTTFLPSGVLAHGNYTYGHRGSTRYAPDSYDSWIYQPAGGAFSTPTELVRFALAMMSEGGGVVSPQSAAMMQAEQINIRTLPGEGYGFGIGTSNYRGLEMRSHSGCLTGWCSSVLLWVPERLFAVALLANSQNSINDAVGCPLRWLLDVPRQQSVDLTTDPSTWGKYTGTYVMLEPSGNETTYWLVQEDDRLRAVVDMAGIDLGGPVVQAYLDTFYYDGQPYTLIPDPDDDTTTRWMRHRQRVGTNVGSFPMTVQVQPNSCTDVSFTPDMALGGAKVMALGLTPPTLLTGQPAVADDPDDRASASFKTDLVVPDRTGMVTIALRGEDNDDLDLLLVRDGNGDGEITLPEELVAISYGDGANEVIVRFRSLEPGEYQVWVHGYRVEGDDSVFDLYIGIVAGNDLTSGDVQSVEGTGEFAFELCAGDVDVGEEEQLIGLAVIETGSAPRTIALPVRAVAGPPEPPVVYLPRVTRGD